MGNFGYAESWERSFQWGGGPWQFCGGTCFLIPMILMIAFWGMVVAVISIISMWLLIRYKMKIGRQYNSQALVADANCSKACMYLSVVLLISSVGYEITGIGMLDSMGAIGIAILSYREGKEAFEKSKGNLSCSCQGKCH